MYGMLFAFFFFKHKTAYVMRISDWSSDVCSSDLLGISGGVAMSALARKSDGEFARWVCFGLGTQEYGLPILQVHEVLRPLPIEAVPGAPDIVLGVINLRGQVVTVINLRRYLELPRSEEHTSELQSLMRSSYAVFCLKKKQNMYT